MGERADRTCSRRSLGFPNLQSFLNGPEYEVKGIEVNFIVAPMDGLTITAAGSYNKGELKNSPQVISNIPGSPTLRAAGDRVVPGFQHHHQHLHRRVVSVENMFGEPGTEMANSPEIQFNIRARYEWAWGDYSPYRGRRGPVPGRVILVGHQGQSVRDALLDHDGRVVRRQQGRTGTPSSTSINLTDENKSMYSTRRSSSSPKCRCGRGPSACASATSSAALIDRKAIYGPVGQPTGPFDWCAQSFII